MTDAALSVRLAAGLRRSTRAAMAACRVARHTDLGAVSVKQVGAAGAADRAAFGQVADDFFGEERVAGGAFGDALDQPVHRGIGAEQLTDQRGGLCGAQGPQRDRLRPGHRRQRAAVFGAIGDQHHRVGVRDHGQKVGQHRLADFVDPVGIFDQVQCRLRPGDRCGIHQRREPAPPGIGLDVGQFDVGIGDAEQVVQQQQIFGVGAGNSGADACTSLLAVEVVHAQPGAQQPRYRVEWDVDGMGFAVGGEHLHAAVAGQCSRFANDAALADSRRSENADYPPDAPDRLVENSGDGVQLPSAAHQRGVVAPAVLALSGLGGQAARHYRLFRAFDTHQFRFGQLYGILNEAGGGRAQHHATRWGDRFHPLRHSHLFADGGVTQSPRADVAGDDLPRVQAHSQSQFHAVAALDLGREPGSLFLDVQRRRTCAKCVVLQGDWRTENRHDAVAGELIDHAAPALHHPCGPSDQLGHDLAPSLSTHRRRDIHRMHHIGEQHRHLLVLSRFGGGRYGGAALVAEFRVRWQFGTAGSARQPRRCHASTTHPRSAYAAPPRIGRLPADNGVIDAVLSASGRIVCAARIHAGSGMRQAPPMMPPKVDTPETPNALYCRRVGVLSRAMSSRLAARAAARSSSRSSSCC
jgi:hypothetical protein